MSTIRPLTVKERIIKDANEILDTANRTVGSLEENEPQALLVAEQSLEPLAERIKTLQLRVAATRNRQQTEIPAITESELSNLAATLTAASAVIEEAQTLRMAANADAARTILDLASECQVIAMGHAIPADDLYAVMMRAFSIDQTQLTRGNLAALHTITSILQATAPNLPSFRPAAPLPARTAPTMPVSDRANVRAQQDAEFEVAEAQSFETNYTEVVKSLTHIPVHDFQSMLALYREIHRLSPRTTAEGRQAFGQIVQKVEAAMTIIIDTQAEIDEMAQKQHQEEALQEQQERQERTDSLQGLAQALEFAVAAGNTSPADAATVVQTAFSALKQEDKARLFQALSDLLKPTTQRDLPKTQQGLLFAQWSGTLQQKLAALETLCPQPAVIIHMPPAAPSLREQFEAARGRGTAARPTPARPQPASTSTTAATSSAPVRPQEDLGSAATRSLRALQALLPLLQDNATASGLQEALSQLTRIETSGYRSPFRITQSSPTLVSDRTAFHLYLIHKEERGQLPSDGRYGTNAMAGVHPAAHSERRRAIQRTIAELALETLDQAIHSADRPETIAMLRLLESFELEARDLPQGHRNIAHSLFGRMYHLHQQARQTNSSLADPHDARFRGDFGREAFTSTAEGIDLAVKRAVIQEMLNLLKAAWKA